MCLHAIGDALKLLLIFQVDMRPEDLARRLAKEFPIALGLVGIKEPDRFQGIGDLGSQQEPMLKADFRR